MVGYINQRAIMRSLNIGIDSFLRDIYSLFGLIWPLGDSYNIDVFLFQIDHVLFFYLVIIVVLIILLFIFYKLLHFFQTNGICFFMDIYHTNSRPQYCYSKFCISTKISLYTIGWLLYTYFNDAQLYVYVF